MERHIEENYEQLVREGGRTYQSIAEQADKDGAKGLAAWARKRAAEGGADVTPTAQTGETKTYADHTVPELKDLVKARGIAAESGWVKQSYIDALEAADLGGGNDQQASIDDQLRQLLEARSLSTEGERPELLARLLGADDVDDDQLRTFLESQQLSTEGEHDELVARILEAAAEQSA